MVLNNLTYKKILEVLRVNFPEFNSNIDFETEPYNEFSFFAIFISDSLKGEKNENLLKRIGDFIESMANSKDENVIGLLDHLIIDIYSETSNENFLEKFKDQLSSDTVRFANKSIELWKKGNKIT